MNDFNTYFCESQAGTIETWAIVIPTPKGDKYLVGVEHPYFTNDLEENEPILGDEPDKKYAWRTEKSALDRLKRDGSSVDRSDTDNPVYTTLDWAKNARVEKVSLSFKPKKLTIKSKIYYELLSRDLLEAFGVGGTFEISELFGGDNTTRSDSIYDASSYQGTIWRYNYSMGYEPVIKNMIGLGIIDQAPRRGRTRVFRVTGNDLGLFTSTDDLVDWAGKYIQTKLMDAFTHPAAGHRREAVALVAATIAVIAKRPWGGEYEDIHDYIYKHGNKDAEYAYDTVQASSTRARRALRGLR